MKENVSNFEEAKKIFYLCNGSHFQMVREELYDTYEEYQISKQMEQLWAEELINYNLYKVKYEKNDLNLMHLLTNISEVIINYKKESGYIAMIEMIKERIDDGDSFTKLRMAETILETIQRMHYETFDFKNLDYAIDILNSIIEQPITISDCRYIKDKSSEYQYGKELKERAAEEIREWEKYQDPLRRKFYNIKNYFKKH